MKLPPDRDTIPVRFIMLTCPDSLVLNVAYVGQISASGCSRPELLKLLEARDIAFSYYDHIFDDLTGEYLVSKHCTWKQQKGGSARKL